MLIQLISFSLWLRATTSALSSTCWPEPRIPQPRRPALALFHSTAVEKAVRTPTLNAFQKSVEVTHHCRNFICIIVFHNLVLFLIVLLGFYVTEALLLALGRYLPLITWSSITLQHTCKLPCLRSCWNSLLKCSSVTQFLCSLEGPYFPLCSSVFLNNPSRPREFLFASSRWIQLIVAFPLLWTLIELWSHDKDVFPCKTMWHQICFLLCNYLYGLTS